MTWYRVESTMPQHRKYAPLSDAAFRLAVTAGCWCASNMTDGVIPRNVVKTLTCAPKGKALDRAISELVSSEIWKSAGENAWLVHDFLSYNMSKAQWEEKVAAAKAGGNAKAAKGKKDATPSPVPHGTPDGKADGMPEPCQNSAESLPQPLPDSDPIINTPKSPKKNRKQRMELTGPPDELVPVKATLDKAIQMGCDWQAEWERCRDHHLKKGNMMADWNAALRTWLGNTPTFGKAPVKPKPPQPKQQLSILEQMAIAKAR